MSTSDTYSSAIYLDLELNCHDFAQPGQGAPGIIEIGLAEMNLASLRIVREATYLVRPRNLEVTRRCTRITGITREDLKDAHPFRDVIGLISTEWPGKAKCVAWGNDEDILARTCKEHRVRMPFRHCLDLSRILQNALAMNNQPSLRSAMAQFGISLDGVSHVALVDARNTAWVHAEIIRRLRDRTVDPSTVKYTPTPTQPSWFAVALANSLKALPLTSGSLRRPGARSTEHSGDSNDNEEQQKA